MFRNCVKEKESGFRIALVAGLLFFTCGCVRHFSSHKSESPAITASTGPITEIDLGVPFYPNSTPDTKQSFSFQGKSEGANPVKTISASFTTADSVDQVESFYRKKLGSQARIVRHPSGAGILVDIALEKNQGETRIQVVSQTDGRGAVIVVLSQVHK